MAYLIAEFERITLASTVYSSHLPFLLGDPTVQRKHIHSLTSRALSFIGADPSTEDAYGGELFPVIE